MDNNRETRWIWIAIAVIVTLLFLCTCCVVGSAVVFLVVDQQTAPRPTLEPDPTEVWGWEDDGELESDTPTQSTPLPPTVEPPPHEAEETLQALTETIVPEADIHELGIRLLNVPADTPRQVTETTEYEVGDQRRFNVSNVDTEEQFEIMAELLYKTPHVYMWVEDGAKVNMSNLREAADLFEEHTYPTNRAFFGPESSPDDDVDGDPHLSILHARDLGNTVAGYFSSPDKYVQEVRSDSNEMEMFYINIDNVRIGSDFYNGVLAHEFQHMIHWKNDRNETTWLNEGCSELAMALNDRSYDPGYYSVGGSDISYAYAPDTQLTSWPEGTAGDASANYGGAYLFMEYFLERYGDEATQMLVSHEENGMESVDATLAALGEPGDHKTFFADWMMANLLDDPDLDEGQYGYTAIDPYEPLMDVRYEPSEPVTRTSTVHQYGVDYVDIQSSKPLSFTFIGTSTVKLMDTDAYSGQYLWWSNRSDESDSTLTRRVNLSDAESAELTFQAWYHIEEDWDYAYIIVGTGETGNLPDDLDDPSIEWSILDDEGLGCTTTNPNGNNYGCGLTGLSGGWQRLSADLTPFVGQEIAVRFEYITDAAVNQPGLALDDFEITVDGETVLEDDAEQADEDWIDEGFVRHANVLPQEWIVQMVIYGDNGPQIKRWLLADGITAGSWLIPLDRRTDQAVIAISALAPTTTEIAPYTFILTPVSTP